MTSRLRAFAGLANGPFPCRLELLGSGGEPGARAEVGQRCHHLPCSILRHPFYSGTFADRWGRNLECPGECPHVSGAYAESFVRGFQNAPEDPHHLQASACCKHFMASERAPSTSCFLVIRSSHLLRSISAPLTNRLLCRFDGRHKRAGRREREPDGRRREHLDAGSGGLVHAAVQRLRTEGQRERTDVL